MRHAQSADEIRAPAPTGVDASGDARGLRVALFSGNYNYTRDGANQALNRLTGFLLGRGLK